MIVYSTDPITEDTPRLPEVGYRQWRWVLDVSWTSIEWRCEYRSEKDRTWRYASGYYCLNLTKHFRLGRGHNYYDGPHDSFSLGFLHYCWSGDWCQKCYDGE